MKEINLKNSDELVKGDVVKRVADGEYFEVLNVTTEEKEGKSCIVVIFKGFSVMAEDGLLKKFFYSKDGKVIVYGEGE